MMFVSRRRLEVHLWAPYFGHSSVLDCVRVAILSSPVSINVGAGQNGCHLKWWPENKWYNCPYDGVNNQWSGRGKPGHDDHLLSSWPGKGWVIRSALDLMPVRFSWAEHGGGDDFCQLILPQLGIFWPPLLGCNCSSRGYISCNSL